MKTEKAEIFKVKQKLQNLVKTEIRNIRGQELDVNFEFKRINTFMEKNNETIRNLLEDSMIMQLI